MSIDLLNDLRAKYGTEKAATPGSNMGAPGAYAGANPTPGPAPAGSMAAPFGCPSPGCKEAYTSKDALAEHMQDKHPALDPASASTEKAFRERAFVVQADSGRTVITAPLRELAAVNQGFTYLRGRFVEADNPNANGATWTSDDLEMGAPTVAGGPLNWLHQETKIIGSILDGHLVQREAAAAQGLNTHIVSDAVLWNFLFPRETAAIERAAGENQLYYSMECLSKEVECVDTPGRPGCGESFSYADFNFKRACAHLNARSSVRRFVEPYFLGGAIIVPPVKPGWGQANVDVVRQAAEFQEQHHVADGFMDTEAARMLVSNIMTWANRAA